MFFASVIDSSHGNRMHYTLFTLKHYRSDENYYFEND